MQNKIILIIIFLFFSCNYKKIATGEFNDIILVTSIEDKDLIYPHFEVLFSQIINTPITENIYNVKWIKPEEFFEYQFHNSCHS